MVELNKQVPMPLWYQVKESILENIGFGIYVEEKPLPSEKLLCDEYKVSVITIRKAMDELSKEGVLVKKQGKGTFLRPGKFERKLNTFYGFSQDILNQGSKPARKIISFELKKPKKNILKELGRENIETIYEIRTLTLADNVPIILSKFFIPSDYIPNLSKEDMSDKSIYFILKDKYNIKLKQEFWTIEATILDEYESKLLEVQVDSPALLHEAVSTDDKGRIVMFAKGVLRADKCKLSIILNDEKSRRSNIVLSK